MQNPATAPKGDGPAAGARKGSLKARALHELKEYAIITLYLWVLFALFGLYKRMLLQENGISLWNQSFAIVNALIFGKVILIAQALNVGRRLTAYALIWVVLGRSLMFTILLMLFHIAEEAVRALFEGLPLASSIADFGGGTLLGFSHLWRDPFRRADPVLRVSRGGAGGRRRRALEPVLLPRQESLQTGSGVRPSLAGWL